MKRITRTALTYIAMLMLLSSTVLANRLTDGLRNLGDKLGPALQTTAADFFIFFIIFFSLCWLGFSKWFGEGKEGKGAVVALSIALSLGLSIALVYGAKFSVNKLMPFAVLLLGLVFFVAAYMFLTKTIFKEDKITHKLIAFALAAVVGLVALGLLVSMVCKDGKCENSALMRQVFGSESILDKLGFHDLDDLGNLAEEVKTAEAVDPLSPRAAANSKSAKDALDKAQQSIAEAVKSPDCSRLDSIRKSVLDIRESASINKNAFTDSTSIVNRADAIIVDIDTKKESLLVECELKNNWFEWGKWILGLLIGGALAFWRFNKKIFKAYRDLREKIKSAKKAVEHIEQDTAELRQNIEKQEEIKEEVLKAHEELAEALNMPVKKYSDDTMIRYLRMLEHTLAPVTAALPEGKTGMVGLLQLREEEVKERLDAFKQDLVQKMGKKRAKALIEKVAGIKERLTAKGVSGDEITSEVIVQLFKEHAEKEKSKGRSNKISSSLKKLAEFNKDDVRYAEKLQEAIKKASFQMGDIQKQVEQEFSRFDRFKGRTAQLNDLIGRFSELRSNQIQHLKAIKSDLDKLDGDATVLKTSCHEIAEKLTKLKEELGEEESASKGFFKKVKEKFSDREKKIELIEKMTELLKTLGEMYNKKVQESENLAQIIIEAKQNAERTEKEEVDVVDVQAQIRKVLKDMGVTDKQIEHPEEHSPREVQPEGEPAQEPTDTASDGGHTEQGKSDVPPLDQTPHVEPPAQEPSTEQDKEPEKARHLKDNGVITLEVINSEDKRLTHDFPLDRETTIIGNTRADHIRVTDSETTQATIQQREDGYYIKDTSIRTGTFIENHAGEVLYKVKDWTKLEENMIIKIGTIERVTLIFRYKS